jgi:hypothetical protein
LFIAVQSTNQILRSTIASDGTLSTPVVAATLAGDAQQGFNLSPVTMRTATVGNGTVLVVGSHGNTDQLESFTVDSNGNLVGATTLPAFDQETNGLTIANTGTGGSTVAYVAGQTSLQAFAISSNATLTPLGNAVLAAGSPQTLATVTVGGQTFIYTSTTTNNQVAGFGLNSDGSVNSTPVASAGLAGVGVSVLADPQGNPLLFASNTNATNNLTAFTVSSTGSLTSLGSITAGTAPNLSADSDLAF